MPEGELERRAREWIAPYFNAEHLVRTRDFVVVLEPAAGEALRLAALTHDIERHFPGGPRVGAGTRADDPAYLREHSERSARFVDEWLAAPRAAPELRAAVRDLVVAHEVGGWHEADLLQAADSLSFLAVNGDLPARWVRDGRATAAHARAKLDATLDRIRVPRARALADPLYRRAVAGLGER